MNLKLALFVSSFICMGILFIYIFFKNMTINKGSLYWLFDDNMSNSDKKIMAICFVVMLILSIVGVFIASSAESVVRVWQ